MKKEKNIQTVFLGLVSFLIFIALLSPIVKLNYEQQDKIIEMNYWQIELKQERKVVDKISSLYLGIFTLFSVIISILAILQHKNYNTQTWLCGVNSFVLSIIILLIVFWKKELKSEFVDYKEIPIRHYNLGFFLLLGALFMNICASYFIRRNLKIKTKSYYQARSIK